jgi:hypothetical protein
MESADIHEVVNAEDVGNLSKANKQQKDIGWKHFIRRSIINRMGQYCDISHRKQSDQEYVS